MSASIGDNTLDSRDIERAISSCQISLTGTPFESEEDPDTLAEILAETPEAWKEHFDVQEAEALINWLRLREEAKQYTTEWLCGAILIEDTHFEDYAKQFAEDIGAVSRNESWPKDHIDWQAATEALKEDYTELDEVDGYIYWVRNT